MNRYARDWDEYSRQWDAIYGLHGQGYAYLGDEWNDDGTPERKRDHFYFRIYAERFLQPEMTVLEIGPGGEMDGSYCPQGETFNCVGRLPRNDSPNAQAL